MTEAGLADAGGRMRSAGRFTIEPGAPFLPGHFPGNPVVPGVVLLDHALALLGATVQGRELTLRSAKFQAPVPPGATLDVCFEPEGAAGLSVICLHGTEKVLTAKIGLS